MEDHESGCIGERKRGRERERGKERVRKRERYISMVLTNNPLDKFVIEIQL